MKVGTKTLHDHTAALFEKVKSRPSIVHYPIAESLAIMKKAYDTLVQFKSDVDAWVPTLNFGSHRDTLYKYEDAYKVAFAETIEYRDIIQQVKAVTVAEKASHSRKQRLHRDKYVELFAVKGETVSPPPISKVCGDALFQRIEKPGSLGISVHYHGPILDTNGLSDPACWAHPRLLLPVTDIKDEDKTHWHTECAKRIEENYDALMAKSNESIQTMSTNGAPGGCGSIAAAHAFAWNPDGATDDQLVFKCPGDVRMPVLTYTCGRAFFAYKYFAYRLHSMFIHVFSGTCVITLLPHHMVADSPNMLSFMNKAPSTTLSKCATFIVSTGSSLWVPFGWYPIVVGVPTWVVG